jgi:hypothetical protein
LGVIERYRPLLTGYWPLLDARKKLRSKTTPSGQTMPQQLIVRGLPAMSIRTVA